ncbi:MAG: cytochrome P450, partial [Alphaproteobacteria bacterium]|nr:cytochrome P450 [Alphaproteobacteria bacterium]
WIPTWDDLRARAPLAYFRKELSQLVAARRRQLDASPADAPHDFLTLLLSTRDPEGGALFGEAEVFDNVMTFVFAGHETTANALAWTLYLLALHPQWDVRLAEEVHNESEVERLVLTRMVLEESLRLYPPAPIISRDSIGPDTVGGIEIRANTSVMISPWVLHRHRLLWNEPDYFDPDRFGPGRRESIHRFAYLPFGAGPRVCIGMGFSLQEATIILSAILRQFRLELLPGQAIEPQARLTLRPRHGIRMRVHRR